MNGGALPRCASSAPPFVGVSGLVSHLSASCLLFRKSFLNAVENDRECLDLLVCHRRPVGNDDGPAVDGFRVEPRLFFGVGLVSRTGRLPTTLTASTRCSCTRSACSP
jgi:hypothetical protein